jgi:hypothetical protein
MSVNIEFVMVNQFKVGSLYRTIDISEFPLPLWKLIDENTDNTETFRIFDFLGNGELFLVLNIQNDYRNSELVTWLLILGATREAYGFLKLNIEYYKYFELITGIEE